MFAYQRKTFFAAVATVSAVLASQPTRSQAATGQGNEAEAASPSAASPPAAAPATGDDDEDSDTASGLASQAPAPAASPAVSEAPSTVSAVSADSCLTRTICAVKEKIRWQTPAWTPTQCRRISDAVAGAARKYDLSPTLLLAIMINESDMNEKALRVYTREGKVYAKDGGLMAIRCHVDAHDRCTNGDVRGMPWKQLMDPVTNIELGARMLAHYRDGGAVMEKTVTKRDASGHLVRVTKEIPCNHKTHAFWAHYNHGPRYIDKGYPRHYPHRIAVIDHALATVMNSPAPELANNHITVHDVGKRARTPDRPIEVRYKKLTNQILSSGSCSPLALLR